MCIFFSQIYLLHQSIDNHSPCSLNFVTQVILLPTDTLCLTMDALELSYRDTHAGKKRERDVAAVAVASASAAVVASTYKRPRELYLSI